MIPIITKIGNSAALYVISYGENVSELMLDTSHPEIVNFNKTKVRDANVFHLNYLYFYFYVFIDHP